MALPVELLDHVFDFVAEIDLYHFRSHLSSRQQQRLRDRVEWIVDRFPPPLVLIFTGIETILSFPILEWNDRFLGATGYIDRLAPHDMTHPVMMGEDMWSRPFIAFRTYKIYDPKKEPAVDVFFRRYKNSDRWACAHHGSGFTISTMNIFTRDALKKDVSSLLCYGYNETRVLC